MPMKTKMSMNTSELQSSAVQWPRMVMAGIGALAFTVACVPPPDQAAGAPGALAFGEPAAVVHVDTNRRMVMETSTGPRAEAEPAEGDTELAQSALTNPAGTITTKVFLCGTGIPASINVLQCTVPPTFVLVGGGAWASSSGGAGAMLTASYPFDSDLTTWEGRSKDHGVVDKHVISVYAIGMMVQGMSRDALRAHITLTTATSASSAHPFLLVNGPAKELGLSGGAKVNYTGPGSMLVQVRPGCGSGDVLCDGWSMEAKDHVYSDPSTLTGYVITIKPSLPPLGALKGRTEIAWGATKVGAPSSVRLEVGPRSALTGLGAFSHCNSDEAGRMLTRMGPTTSNPIDPTNPDSVTFEDKDHLERSIGQVEGYALFLR
jgi:vibriolysin